MRLKLKVTIKNISLVLTSSLNYNKHKWTLFIPTEEDNTNTKKKALTLNLNNKSFGSEQISGYRKFEHV